MKDFPYTPQDFLTVTRTAFIEGRYPYTYAADYIRDHLFDICRVMELPYEQFYVTSRFGAVSFMQDLNEGNEDYEHIARVFADAYLIENGITKP